jgi:phospholipid-transporting ATPase
MVTMEIVKFVQSTMIDNDLDIYYDKTDTPAVARSSSLIEELGQVEYVFSDKTGTLTCNEMEFRECSIAGLSYANQPDPDRQPANDNDSKGQYSFEQMEQHLHNSQHSNVIHEFLTSLMTCHTVIPETKEGTDEIAYQASSPDEGALVTGASKVFNYHFYARRPHSINCKINGVDHEYQILNVCEFNSTRKRMSVVIRGPDGKVKLYCKGADTVILERLNNDNPFVDATLDHLEVRKKSNKETGIKVYAQYLSNMSFLLRRTLLVKVSELFVMQCVKSPMMNMQNGLKFMTMRLLLW